VALIASRGQRFERPQQDQFTNQTTHSACFRVIRVFRGKLFLSVQRSRATPY